MVREQTKSKGGAPASRRVRLSGGTSYPTGAPQSPLCGGPRPVLEYWPLTKPGEEEQRASDVRIGRMSYRNVLYGRLEIRGEKRA